MKLHVRVVHLLLRLVVDFGTNENRFSRNETGFVEMDRSGERSGFAPETSEVFVVDPRHQFRSEKFSVRVRNCDDRKLFLEFEGCVLAARGDGGLGGVPEGEKYLVRFDSRFLN